MNNSARTKINKFCSFCKRTNHTWDECYHRKRWSKEKQTRSKNNSTEPQCENFSKILKIFEKLSLKNAKKVDFSEKLMGYQNHLAPKDTPKGNCGIPFEKLER